MPDVTVTSSAPNVVVETAAAVNITGQTLPAGSTNQTLVFSGGSWQPGFRMTVSQSAPSGGSDGDIWIVVP